jgi:hypothetical protein
METYMPDHTWRELNAKVTDSPTQQLITERAKSHGDFNATAQCAQMLKHVIAGQLGAKVLTFYQQESLDMICLKVGRIVAGDDDLREHWVDISGYAMLVAERCSK